MTLFCSFILAKYEAETSGSLEAILSPWPTEPQEGNAGSRVLLLHHTGFHGGILCSWEKRAGGKESISLSCEASDLRQMENVKAWIALLEKIWDSLKQEKYYALSDGEERVRHFRENYADRVIHHLPPLTFWLNFYGPQLMRRWGEKTLMGAPRYVSKRRGEGILQVLSRNPHDFSKDTHWSFRNLMKYYCWENIVVQVSPEGLCKIGKAVFSGEEDLREALLRRISSARQKGVRHLSVFFYRGLVTPPNVQLIIRNLVPWLREELHVADITVDRGD